MPLPVSSSPLQQKDLVHLTDLQLSLLLQSLG
jgi:hypothetical protein